MPTDAEYIALIKSELNVGTDTTFDANILIWWAEYSGKTTSLRRLYTKRDALEYLQGKLREMIDLATGSDRVSLNQQFTNISKMLDRVDKRISEDDPYSTVPRMSSRQPRGSSLALEDEEIATQTI